MRTERLKVLLYARDEIEAMIHRLLAVGFPIVCCRTHPFSEHRLEVDLCLSRGEHIRKRKRLFFCDSHVRSSKIVESLRLPVFLRIRARLEVASKRLDPAHIVL